LFAVYSRSRTASDVEGSLDPLPCAPFLPRDDLGVDLVQDRDGMPSPLGHLRRGNFPMSQVDTQA
jgi:hypothetical protein